jgi:phosphate transport system protein
MSSSEHTSKKFDAELEAVRARVLQMGGIVEDQIVRGLDALARGDTALAARVVEDDHRVNALEVAIDEDCSTIIARRQPAAGDLRMLLMIVKTITDLERIGDEAAKIARMTQRIYESDRPSHSALDRGQARRRHRARDAAQLARRLCAARPCDRRQGGAPGRAGRR